MLWSSGASSEESSKGGKEGRDGMSLSSIASILRQTRDGVSSIFAMAQALTGPPFATVRARDDVDAL